jgi:hypothetical protein
MQKAMPVKMIDQSEKAFCEREIIPINLIGLKSKFQSFAEAMTT